MISAAEKAAKVDLSATGNAIAGSSGGGDKPSGNTTSINSNKTAPSLTIRGAARGSAGTYRKLSNGSYYLDSDIISSSDFSIGSAATVKSGAKARSEKDLYDTIPLKNASFKEKKARYVQWYDSEGYLKKKGNLSDV
jgi:hypothetical protein